MANKAKAKGTAFETAIVNYLNEPKHPLGQGSARRLPPHGSIDKGDVEYVVGSDCFIVTLQAKAQKAFDLAGWVDAAKEQSVAADSMWGVAVVKRPKKNIKDAYVVMDLETFKSMMETLV